MDIIYGAITNNNLELIMNYKPYFKTIIGVYMLAAGCLFTWPALATDLAPPIDCQIDQFDSTDVGKQSIAVAYCDLANIPHKVDGNIWGKYRLMRHAGAAFENPAQLCEPYTVTRWKRDYDKEPRIDRMLEIAEDTRVMAWWDVEKVSNPDSVIIIDDLNNNLCSEPVDCAAEPGEYTIEMQDTDGDGWQGDGILVSIDGVESYVDSFQVYQPDGTLLYESSDSPSAGASCPEPPDEPTNSCGLHCESDRDCAHGGFVECGKCDLTFAGTRTYKTCVDSAGL